MNRLFIALIIIFCSRILFPQNIPGLANYKMLDAFASGSPSDTFISAEFLSATDTVGVRIAYYFANKNEWHVLIRDTAGINYAKYSGQIDTGKTVKIMKLFNYKGKKYLALLSKIKSPASGYLVNMGLFIINVSSSQIVNSIEIDPLYYTGYNFPYNELHINHLVILDKNTGAKQILISYTGSGSGTEIGETQWYASESKIMIFDFGDSLSFSNYLDNASNILSKSKIIFGYKGSSSSGPWGNNSSNIFSVYKFDMVDTIKKGETIFQDSSSMDFNLVSSDDSTNWSHPLIFIGCAYLYAISLPDGIAIWQKNFYGLNSCGFTASSNLTVNNHFYFIAFNKYRMWVFNRDNGQQLYYEYGAISPIKILESEGNKLYYLVKAGQQTYALYEMENFNNIVSVKKSKPDAPDKFSISQNYPNPFNPSTTIKYSIPRATHVKLMIYDALGRIIKTPVDGEKSAGNYSVNFEGGNLPSSVYFYQIRAGKYVETRKMLLLK